MLKVPRAEKIAPQLITGFKEVRKGDRTLRRRLKVERRASSLPICPRAYHIYRRLPPHKRPNDTDTFMSETATLLGTALHLVLQKWFGIMLRDHTYGNWGCRYCRKIRRHQLGMQYCQSCNREMTYVEYEVARNDQILTSGHIDMILRYIDMDCLIDFKGAHLKKISYIRQHGPEPKHYYQTNAYANAIRLGRSAGQDFGSLTNIDKIIILYIDRGQPWFNWYPVQLPVSESVFYETMRLIEKAQQSLADMQLPRGLCLTATDDDARWCKWRDMCFSPLLSTMLEDQIYPEDDTPQDRSMEHVLEDPRHHQHTEEGIDINAELTKWNVPGERSYF